MSTQSNRIRKNLVHVIYRGLHLSIDALGGKVKSEVSVVAINDLGPVGKSWTRASISFSDGKAFRSYDPRTDLYRGVGLLIGVRSFLVRLSAFSLKFAAKEP
jgi:hypothetical protein